MPTYGGFSPQPERYGGGRPLVEAILESLNMARGDAFSVEVGSSAYIENMAYARAIAAAWATNQLLAGLWDPARFTQILSRWEAILGLYPTPGETTPDRRAAVAAHFRRFGDPLSSQSFRDIIEPALGDVLDAVVHIPPASAVLQTIAALNIIAIPGIVKTGRAVNSTLLHVLIRVVKPAGWTDPEFYATVATLTHALEGRIPSWITWDWYRNGTAGGGFAPDTDAGFWLDEDHNLDNEILDT